MGRLTHRTEPPWTYFVTTRAWQSTFLFQVGEAAESIVAKMLDYRDKGKYLLYDFVLMANHLYLMLAPAPSASQEKAIQLIKGGSSHEIVRVQGKKSEIWQPGFHESRMTSWGDYNKKANYVPFNRVAGKLVERAEDWSYGSASGRFMLDPIPEGLKLGSAPSFDVGPEGPTPVTHSGAIEIPALKAREVHEKR